jgi:hypothetical protein
VGLAEGETAVMQQLAQEILRDLEEEAAPA